MTRYSIMSLFSRKARSYIFIIPSIDGGYIPLMVLCILAKLLLEGNMFVPGYIHILEE